MAGARQKGKNKKRHLSDDSDDSDNVQERPAKKGRPKGSSNFNQDDTAKLLDFVEKLRPAGQKGWAKVERKFNRWAAEKRRPERDAKSLEDRYKRVRLS